MATTDDAGLSAMGRHRFHTVAPASVHSYFIAISAAPHSDAPIVQFNKRVHDVKQAPNL